MSMKIKTLVGSIFNDQNGQAVECAEGDVLVTGDAYGRLLISDGLAVQVFENEVPESVEVPAEEEKKPTVRGKKRGASASNPFIAQ